MQRFQDKLEGRCLLITFLSKRFIEIGDLESQLERRIQETGAEQLVLDFSSIEAIGSKFLLALLRLSRLLPRGQKIHCVNVSSSVKNAMEINTELLLGVEIIYDDKLAA